MPCFAVRMSYTCELCCTLYIVASALRWLYLHGKLFLHCRNSSPSCVFVLIHLCFRVKNVIHFSRNRKEKRHLVGCICHGAPLAPCRQCAQTCTVILLWDAIPSYTLTNALRRGWLREHCLCFYMTLYFYPYENRFRLPIELLMSSYRVYRNSIGTHSQ